MINTYTNLVFLLCLRGFLMGMYGFKIADTMSIVICVRGSWEKGVEFNTTHIPTEK